VKTRVALLLLLLAAVLVVLAIVKFPRPAPTVRPAAPQAAPQITPAQVVVRYLEALDRKDFRAAYSHLSAASRQAHPYDDFVALAEKSGSPSYDLSAVLEKPGEAGQTTVTVPLTEDPAEHGFSLLKEQNAWKLVFMGGVPSSPYP